MIIVDADDREQAKHYTQATQDIHASTCPMRVAANQHTSVLGNYADDRAYGKEEYEGRKDENP